MKILNLYACLGGNRYKWDEVANEAGATIFKTVLGIYATNNTNQISIF